MSTNWTDLDTELSETTTAAARELRPVDEQLVDVSPAVGQLLVNTGPNVDVDLDPVLDTGLDVDVDEGLGDELDEPAGKEAFALDTPADRLGMALMFAAVALAGLALAVFATPTSVAVAGWVIAGAGGLMAFRELAGGDAR